MATHYELLGVEQDATAEDIKKAWRKIARTTHPDTASSPGAEHIYLAVQEAYNTLSDPSRRAAYDRELKSGSSSDDYSSSMPPPPPPPSSGTTEQQWGTESSWADSNTGQAHTEQHTQEPVRGWEPEEEENKPSLFGLAWGATKSVGQWIFNSPYKHLFLVAIIGLPATIWIGYKQAWLVFAGALVVAFLAKFAGGTTWRRWLWFGLLAVQGALAFGIVSYSIQNGEASMVVVGVPVMAIIALLQRVILKPLANQPKNKQVKTPRNTTEITYHQS